MEYAPEGGKPCLDTLYPPVHGASAQSTPLGVYHA